VTGVRAWPVVGAVLAVVSLGLSWGGAVSGAAHPARVAVVGALVLAAAAWRTGRARLLDAALVVGAVGLLVGGVDASPGRLVFATALGCLLRVRAQSSGWARRASNATSSSTAPASSASSRSHSSSSGTDTARPTDSTSRPVPSSSDDSRRSTSPSV